MDSINQKLETVLQKLSSIEQECLEERLGYFGNQIQNLVNSVQKLSTKIETLESYMIRGRQTHNPTAKKVFLLYLVAYLISYHEKARKALQLTCLEVASHLSTTQRYGIPLTAFPSDTTSKLAVAGLFFALSL